MTNSAITASPFTQRQTQPDRRQNNASFWTLFRTNGRRKAVRRNLEAAVGRYFDHYEPRLVVPSLIILVLCMIDGHMTLKLLALGATEMNLLMKLAIEKGVITFLVTKYLMTATSVVFLMIHHQFRVFNIVQVRHIIYGYAWLYIALLIYEISMWTYLA